MRIPRVTHLPGGFRVETRLVTEERLAELTGSFARRGHDIPEALWIWDGDDRGTIYLDRKRTPKQRALDFEHETGHVHTDWRTWWRRKWGLE